MLGGGKKGWIISRLQPAAPDLGNNLGRRSIAKYLTLKK